MSTSNIVFENLKCEGQMHIMMLQYKNSTIKDHFTVEFYEAVSRSKLFDCQKKIQSV